MNAWAASMWRSTLISDAVFMLRLFESGKHICPLWFLPGFVVSMVCLDLMHVGCLGIVQALGGNILFEMFIKLGGLVTNPMPVVAELVALIKMGAKHLKIQAPVNKLTLAMIKVSGLEPRLKGKAAECRRMLKVLHFLLSVVLPPETAHERLRLDCLTQLHLFYEELEQWVPGSAVKCAAFARNHVVLYSEMTRNFLQAGFFDSHGYHLYKMYPKHHLFVHLGYFL